MHTSRFAVHRDLCLLASLALLPCAFVRADDDAAAETPADTPAVSYWREVRPILVERCQGCHQPAKAGGKVVLTSFASLGVVAAGEGTEAPDEPLVTPGKPELSRLYLEITPQEGEPPAMPKKAAPLADHDVSLIRRWIEEGARDDTPASVRQKPSAEHPPKYSALPVVTSLDYSPDGHLLAVSGYHEVLLHRVDTGADGAVEVGLEARLVGLSERIERAVFSPDGTRLAVTGGTPCEMGEVQIWDLESRKLRVSANFTFDTLYGASWSGDGALVAFGCADNSIRAIDSKTGEQKLFQGAHSDWVRDTDFSTDNSHLVSVSRDGSMKLIKVDTEQFMDNITSITPGALKGGLLAVDRNPTKDELLIGGADGVPKIYRMYREKARQIGDDFNHIRSFDPLPGRIFDARFSHDGSFIAVAASDDGTGEVRVYSVEDGKLRWKLETAGGAYAVAIRPDGLQVAVSGFDGRVRIIDAAEGKIVKEFDAAPLEAPGTVAKK